MPRRGPKRPPSWSMYPELHDQVADKLEEVQLDYSFFEQDNDYGIIQGYDTNIMGRFVCHNQKCSNNGWSSKMIAVTIREYSRDRYNVRVFHQRCKQCKSLSRPILDEESYIDRVTYRIKTWNGVDVERPIYSGDSKGPHEDELCEGCKNGHCNRSNTSRRRYTSSMGNANGLVDYLFD